MFHLVWPELSGGLKIKFSWKVRLCFWRESGGVSCAVKDLQTVDASAKLSTDGREGKKATSEQLLVDQTAHRGAARASNAPHNGSF